ncbi:unnamed protein product, partial [Thlaspi arvense]
KLLSQRSEEDHLWAERSGVRAGWFMNIVTITSSGSPKYVARFEPLMTTDPSQRTNWAPAHDGNNENIMMHRDYWVPCAETLKVKNVSLSRGLAKGNE